jgi:hypothetical protein
VNLNFESTEKPRRRRLSQVVASRPREKATGADFSAIFAVRFNLILGFGARDSVDDQRIKIGVGCLTRPYA